MKIIDLTQAFYIGLKPYDAPWYPKFDIENIMKPESDPNGTTRTFTQHTIFPHNATHVESSLHFYPDGTSIDKVPLEKLVGRAILADLSYKSHGDIIDSDDLDGDVGDIVLEGDRLLIRTDYMDKYWDNGNYWDNPPYLTADAVSWMVEKKISLLGLDCLTDKPSDKTSPVHKKLLQNEIPILEYIKNMKSLSSRVVFLVALPLLIQGVEASAARVIAIEDFEVRDNEKQGTCK